MATVPSPITVSVTSTANTWVELYTVPSSVTYNYCTVTALNTDPTNDATISIAISNGTSPVDKEYIEYNTVLLAKNNSPNSVPGGLERGQFVVKPGEKIMVKSSNGSTNFRLFGFNYTTSERGVFVSTGLITPGSNTLLATTPASTVALFGTYNINVINLSTGAVDTRLAISSTTTPAASEWIEYDTSIPANGGIMRPCLPIPPNYNVIGYIPAGSGSIAVRVAGVTRQPA